MAGDCNVSLKSSQGVLLIRFYFKLPPENRSSFAFLKTTTFKHRMFLSALIIQVISNYKTLLKFLFTGGTDLKTPCSRLCENTKIIQKYKVCHFQGALLLQNQNSEFLLLWNEARSHQTVTVLKLTVAHLKCHRL